MFRETKRARTSDRALDPKIVQIKSLYSDVQLKNQLCLEIELKNNPVDKAKSLIHNQHSYLQT